jgi:hypothetical protein
MTNTHGTAYYVTRSFVRFIFALVVTAGIFIGIPVAVGLMWPALILAAVLWTIVAWMYFHEQKKLAASVAS